MPDETMSGLPQAEASTPLAIGGMRFSVVSEKTQKGWVATRSISIEESVAIIFAEQRMASRFRLFEAVTLPFFRYASEQRQPFRLCILASSLMPKPWRQRLQDLTKDIPEITCLYVKPHQHPMRLFQRFVRSQMTDADGAACTFRLDDDDCVNADYLNNLQKINNIDNIGKVFSHENGLYIAHRDGTGLIFSDINYRANAFGIANVSSAADCATIYSLGNHVKLEQRWPFETFDTPRAWLRTIHGSADTAARKHDLDSWAPLSEIEEDFRRLYPFIDIGQMTEALAPRG